MKKIKVEVKDVSKSFSKVDEGKPLPVIQNVSFNEAGKLVKNTVKVHKNINEETLKSLVGKTVKIENVEEYKKGFKFYYAGKDIKKIDKDVEF